MRLNGLIKSIRLPQNPVFIVGYPRSGTTLLQYLLASQKNIYTFPETHFFSTINLVIETDVNGFVKPKSITNIFEQIYEKIELRFKKNEIESISSLILNKEIKPKQIFEYIIFYFLYKEMGNEVFEKKFRWIEKTPNHAFFLDTIYSFYPNAQFIYIMRHPVPAIYSRKSNFPNKKNKSLSWYAERWLLNLEKAEVFAKKNEDIFHWVRYEDLTSDIEHELKKIVNFLTIDLDMNYIKTNDLGEYPFILNSETWKRKKYNGFSNNNDEYKSLISIDEAISIENILIDKMKQYAYKPFFN